jgi:hypothetical protein
MTHQNNEPSNGACEHEGAEESAYSQCPKCGKCLIKPMRFTKQEMNSPNPSKPLMAPNTAEIRTVYTFGGERLILESDHLAALKQADKEEQKLLRDNRKLRDENDALESALKSKEEDANVTASLLLSAQKMLAEKNEQIKKIDGMYEAAMQAECARTLALNEANKKIKQLESALKAKEEHIARNRLASSLQIGDLESQLKDKEKEIERLKLKIPCRCSGVQCTCKEN